MRQVYKVAVASAAFLAAVGVGTFFSPFQDEVKPTPKRLSSSLPKSDPIQTQSIVALPVNVPRKEQSTEERRRIELLNGAAQELLVPWSEWFSLLELQGLGIEIDSVSYSAKARTLQLSGRTKSDLALSTFQNALTRKDVVKSTHIITLSKDDSQEGVSRFDLRVILE